MEVVVVAVVAVVAVVVVVVVVVAVADSDIPGALRNEATLLPDIYVFLPIVAGISSDRCF